MDGLQVIKYLVDQRARNEFLTMAYEIEGRNHRDVHRLLTAAQQTLHDRLDHFQTRIVRLWRGQGGVCVYGVW